MCEKGKKYRVIEDNSYFFIPGEIVVALENDSVPYCVREKEYLGKTDLDCYCLASINPLKFSELEEIEEG